MQRSRSLCARESARHRPPRLLRAVVIATWLSFAGRAAAVHGDADCSGAVTAADLPAVLAALFEPTACGDADVNGDGANTVSDVTAELPLLLAAAQRPAVGQVLDEIDADGSINLNTARELFQVVYGGLDGVTVPNGPPGGNVDGTIALEAMLQHIDDLSGDDLARLNEVLNIDGPTGQTIPPGGMTSVLQRAAAHPAVVPAAAALPAPLPSDNEDVQYFIQGVEFWLPQLEAFAQLPFALPIDIDVYASAVPGAAADGMTVDANGGGGVPARCRLRFYQGAIDLPVDTSGSDRQSLIVRELWNCFEAVIVGDRDTLYRESKWLVDGQTEYVAAFFSRRGSIPFGDYLARPAVPLFARATDAIGFYVTMENNHTAMSPTLKAMLLAGVTSASSASLLGTNEAAFDIALSATARLLDTWAENEFLDQFDGPDWTYTVSTGFPAGTAGQVFPGTVQLNLGDGSAELVQVPAHSVFLWTAYITTDLVHFQIHGPARAIGALGAPYDDLSDTWLCRSDDPESCKCPPGSEGQAPESQLVSASMKIAASAGDEPVEGAITSISLEQFCKQKQPPPPTTAFCADAKNLLATVKQFVNSDLSSVSLQTQLQADVYWLGRMTADAPADIVDAVQPVAAAYVEANSDFGSVGYALLPTSLEILQAQNAAIKAVGAVASQSQQVGAYIARVCGFEFTLNGV